MLIILKTLKKLKKQSGEKMSKEIKKEYLKICKTYGVKPFSFQDKTLYETIQGHYSLSDDLTNQLEDLCIKLEGD